MIRQFIVLNCVLGLLLTTSPGWTSVSSFHIGAQGSFIQKGHYQGTVYAGLSNVILQRKNNILFTDLRLSTNDYHVKGLHIGLGNRMILNNFTIGLHSSYDLYNNKNRTRQYVGGIDVLYDIFRFRWNFYYPHSSHKNVYVGMKGSSKELEMKIAQTQDVFLILKKYNFSDIIDDHVDGYGASIKYTSNFHSRLNFYLSGGYQHDNKHEHQLSIDSGMKIALGNRQNLMQNYYEAALPFTRNMFVYGHNANTSIGVMYTKDQNIHDVINKAGKNSTIILKDDSPVEKTIQLKSGQKLYGNTKKHSKIYATSDLTGPLLTLSNDVEIKNIEFDAASIHHTTNQIDNIQQNRTIKQPQDQGHAATPTIGEEDKKTNIADSPVNQSKETDAIIFAASHVKNINISNNKVYGHAQDELHGILFHNGGSNIKINNNIIKNNKKISAIQANDILAESEISGNNIEGTGENAFGISLAISKNNKINNNTVKVQGKAAHGIYIDKTNGKNYLEDNNITTNGDSDTHAIYLHQKAQDVTINNNQLDSDGQTTGNVIYLWDGGEKNSIIGNKISANGASAKGIYYGNVAKENQIKNNTILTSGKTADGIRFSNDMTHNIIANNTIIGTSNDNSGIRVDGLAKENSFAKNNINHNSTNVGDGISLRGDSINNLIEGNIFSGKSSADNRILFNKLAKQNKIINNNIVIHVDGGNAIKFNFTAEENQITNNTILTSGKNADGLHFNAQSNKNIIEGNTITENSKNGDGIHFASTAEGNKISNNDINTSGQDAEGIYFNAQSNKNIIESNTIIGRAEDDDGIYFHNTAEGNKISNNKLDIKGKNADGLIFSNNATNNTVIENTIKIESTDNRDIGIDLRGTTNHMTFSDNILNTTNQSLRFKNKTEQTIIQNNTINVTGKDKPAIEFLSTSEKIDKNKLKKENKIKTNGGAEVVVTASSN